MIELQDVSKAYPIKGGVKTVLEGLSMTIPRTRSLALLGRNGAGKSTLLSMIAGSTKPDRGRIVRNCRVSFPLGFAGSFHRDMTGAQNLRFVSRIYGVDAEMLTDYVSDFAELGPYLNQPVRVYSSGMKARLAFGVSMGIAFDTYLVDELTAVGDQNFRIKSRRVFEEKLSTSNVVMVSHSVGQLRDYCNCGMVLENGRVEVYDDLEEAIERHEENMRLSREDDGGPRGRGRRREAAKVKARMKRRRGARRGMI